MPTPLERYTDTFAHALDDFRRFAAANPGTANLHSAADDTLKGLYDECSSIRAQAHPPEPTPEG